MLSISFAVRFTNKGYTGRTGIIQEFTVPKAGTYRIELGGASGGNHTFSYGPGRGTYYGGKGATMKGDFILPSGLVLKIVVGHRGGKSVEIRGGRRTTSSAASLGESVEDNAGTGGGGGSFVYNSSNVLYVAAGGGGGASNGYNGVNGSSGINGLRSNGSVEHQRGTGGSNGRPGFCCYSGSWPGGVGAGWIASGNSRRSTEYGEAGGSRDKNWIGGRAGNMNSGNNGGPAPGGAGGFGGGGGGSEDNGASGGGGGYSGGGTGTQHKQAGGGGGSYCNGTEAVGGSCHGVDGGNTENEYGYVTITYLS